MNLGDPELELVDPTPNVHLLFLHLDQVFFWTKLASRAVVRWSKRMYSCAGICSYDRGGLCDIALSESLLKLRPRKDLVETLLHEMIHAYLFITHRDQDRDGHGPNFKEHMYRINKAAGLNISIYHDFHDEVELYKTHWWRCNGPCHTRKPHFGIVRRSMNRAPGPTDYWWKNHQRYCGGTFLKIKEPENYGKNKKTLPKPSKDITKYINTTGKVNNKNDGVLKPVLKSSNNVPHKSNVITKSNNSSTIVVSKVNNIVFNPQIIKPPVLFSGKGKTLSGENSGKSADVVKTVRNVWAKKFLSPNSEKKDTKGKSIPKRNSFDTISINSGKHKSESEHINSPPAKMKKIDDYFKSTATTLLKDLYGEQFEIKETDGLKRLSAVPVDLNLVNCPVCTNKVSNEIINRHLDECLNKDVIEKNTDTTAPVINIKPEDNKLKGISIKSSISNYIKKEHDPVPYLDIKVQMVTSTDVNSNRLGDKKYVEDVKMNADIPSVKIEPGNSKEILRINEQRCPCCGKIVSKSINEHLDECLAFFDNDTTVPLEGTSTSFAKETIVIDDDDDIFDETLTLNATGTKSPCPCCLKMIEQADMNDHLDLCLS